MPALEALAAGAPLVASDITSIPEVVSDAGVLVDPTSEEAIAGAVERVMKDDSLRERLRAAGPLRAEGFSWDRAAESTLEAYREVKNRA